MDTFDELEQTIRSGGPDAAFEFLSKIPWTPDLARVPEREQVVGIAGLDREPRRGNTRRPRSLQAAGKPGLESTESVSIGHGNRKLAGLAGVRPAR